MAPNPIIVPRKQAASSASHSANRASPPAHGVPIALAWTSLAFFAFATLPWARHWFYSGAAIESLILLYGSTSTTTRIFPEIPLWSLLASLNLVYAIASTSWLLYGFFAALCYPCAVLTCLFQSTWASNFARRRLRSLLRQTQFLRDKIALFNLPGLEIDTDVHGLLVVRGVTISLSSLTIEAHGIELGLKLADDLELAMYTDDVVIRLFRHIDVGEVYAVVKGGLDMTFAGVEKPNQANESSVFEVDTPLLRAASGGPDGLKEPGPRSAKATATPRRRPTFPTREASFREGLEAVTAVSPDDADAEKQYHHMRQHLHLSSPLYQSRELIEDRNSLTEMETRAITSAKLGGFSSILHPPTTTIRVTTLQNLLPQPVRTFLHRLPFLLRLLLMPLSYFHPITISSICATGSGSWLVALLQEKVFKHYADHSHEIRRLQATISDWLAPVDLCLALGEIDALAQVPLRTIYDVNAYLRCAEIASLRAMADSDNVETVVQLGGADLTCTIPSNLLPHHEHLLPPPPSTEDQDEQAAVIEHTDAQPQKQNAKRDLHLMENDETEIYISAHASLPACFDQSVLNFVAALVKAAKIIETEKEGEEVVDDNDADEDERPSPTSEDSGPQHTSPASDSHSYTAGAGAAFSKRKFASLTKNLQQNFRDANHTLKNSMKKGWNNSMAGLANERWIAKLVGKVATHLEKGQGDVGYSGGIPISLAPYRNLYGDGRLTKFLP